MEKDSVGVWKTPTIQLHIITVKPLIQAGGKTSCFFCAERRRKRMKELEIALIILSCGARLLEVLDED